ncbi:hypothetical protein OI25_3415 [Paraburkholderia fungorum]|uniref:Uncharacterized protein n=1 Tax=Paraburkholderia fungorum TaxID=134537 RepID=A0AAU8SV78_9BURK|nr:hypothetical protein OI25_3415 [Paraburkholderia fungorum]
MFSHERTHQYSREGAATGELKPGMQNGQAKGVQLTDRHNLTLKPSRVLFAARLSGAVLVFRGMGRCV